MTTQANMVFLVPHFHSLSHHRYILAQHLNSRQIHHGSNIIQTRMQMLKQNNAVYKSQQQFADVLCTPVS